MVIYIFEINFMQHLSENGEELEILADDNDQQAPVYRQKQKLPDRRQLQDTSHAAIIVR